MGENTSDGGTPPPEAPAEANAGEALGQDSAQTATASSHEPSASARTPEATSPAGDKPPADQSRESVWDKMLQSQRLPSRVKRIAEHRLNMAAAEEWRQSGAKRDPAGNATTRLPPGEEVRVPVIWLAEIFTPTTIDGLINGVRELAGRPSGAWQTSADDIIEWIRSSRADGLFSYKNANYILPKGRGIDPKITDQLPAGISYIHLRLYTLTPSITVLTATFGLEDEKARGLEDILNHNYSTQIEKNPDGFSLLSVGLQKDRHADEWRAAIRDDAARWLARRLPGFFHKLAPGQLPTIELLLTGIYRPWEPVVKLSDVPGWTGIIDISGGFGYWQCDGIDCLRLSERHARARKPDQ